MDAGESECMCAACVEARRILAPIRAMPGGTDVTAQLDVLLAGMANALASVAVAVPDADPSRDPLDSVRAMLSKVVTDAIQTTARTMTEFSPRQASGAPAGASRH